MATFWNREASRRADARLRHALALRRTALAVICVVAGTFTLASCSETLLEPLPDDVRSPDSHTPPVVAFDHISNPTGFCADPVTSGAIVIDEADDCFLLGVAFIEASLIGVTGTGVFSPFKRWQANGTEEGHNTSARPLLNDENSSPNWTRNLNLAHVPQVMFDDNFVRREWRLDINESSNTSLLSIDEIRVYATDDPDQTFGSFAAADAALGAPLWFLDDNVGPPLNDRWIQMDYNLAPGSGKGDLFLYIRDDQFGAGPECDYNGGLQPPDDCDIWIVFWTTAGENNASDDGFEEWSVRIDVAVDVEKTAVASFDREFIWEVEKSADPDWHLFDGDAGISEYAVTATVTGTEDSNHQVEGTVTFENNSGFNLDLTMITDEIARADVDPVTPESITCTRDRGNATIEVGVELSGGDRNFNSGDVITCEYAHASFPDIDLSGEWTNTFTASLIKAGQGQSEDTEFQATATANFEFTNDVANLVNETVEVTDTFEDEDPVSLGTAMYTESPKDFFPAERTFACPDDEDTFTNVARIIGEGDVVLDTDAATVTVTCYEIAVEKDAETSYTREWDWDIEKVADETEFEVGINDFVTVNYTLRVFVSGPPTDSDFAVEGEITISNPNPVLEATVNSVADIITNAADIPATVECPGDAPYTVPVHVDGTDGTLVCTYSADLPDAEDRTNTATATQQHYLYGPDGVIDSERPTSDHSGDADVIFGDPTTVLDACVTITDEYPEFAAAFGGDPVERCLDEADPENTEYTFEYSVEFGDFETCDVHEFENVAVVTENDTGDENDDMVTVVITVICEGCTLTQGYWKTHSEFGPAPYDATWALVQPAGASSEFFLSGQTWYEVFHTAPSGNAYYILAHQWMAAYLNVLNEASIWNGALDALNAGQALLEAYSPADIAGLSGDDPLREQFIMYAGILDDYNNGVTGPGHCDDLEPVIDPNPTD